MTLPRFLDCAFTLLFDEYQRAGQDLLTAMEKLQEWAGTPKIEDRSEAAVVAQNQASMKQFQTMMMGLRR